MKQSNEMTQLNKWPGLKFIIGLVVAGFIAGIYFERGTHQLIRKYYDYQWIAYLLFSAAWIVVAVLHAVRFARMTKPKPDVPCALPCSLPQIDIGAGPQDQ